MSLESRVMVRIAQVFNFSNLAFCAFLSHKYLYPYIPMDFENARTKVFRVDFFAIQFFAPVTRRINDCVSFQCFLISCTHSWAAPV